MADRACARLAAGRSSGLPLPRGTLLKFGRRYLLRHPWQTVLMIVGIMLGVAVVVAIDLANTSAARAFDLSTDAVVGRATHQVLGGPTGLEEGVYVEMRRAGIPVAAAPVVVEYVVSPELGDRPLQLLGIDPFAEAPFRSYLSSPDAAPGHSHQDLTAFYTVPGAVLLTATLADRYDLGVGSAITLEAAGIERPAVIAGVLEPADSLSRRALEGILLADVATAQELTGRLGVLDRIDLILPEGNTALQGQIKALLPAGSQLVEVEARSGTVAEMTAAFRTNLTALSLLALVVGLFLIYNTMTFSVVQRRQLFGTLRSLGVTRREVFILVVTEAAVVGTLGTLLGLALGMVMGQGAVRLVSQTISDLYFVVNVRGVDIPTSSLVIGGLMGLFATVLAAAPPAWEAASVPPRDALSRSQLEAKASGAVWRVALGGLLVLVVGGGLLLIPSRSLAASFGSAFAVVVGFAMLTPLVTALLMQAMTPLMGRLWGALGRMAPRNVVKSLSRTSVAVAALMIAVSVTIGISVMIGSFRNTVEVWLAQSLRGDIYISPPAVVGTQSSGIIDPAVFPILESWPGVRRVDTYRSVQVESLVGPITLSHTQNPSIGEERIYRWVDLDPIQVWQAMEDGALLLSEPLADRIGFSRRGSSLTLITPDGPKAFPVVGVYYDYTSSQGMALMASSVYRAQWGDEAIGAVSLRLASSVDPDRLSRDLADSLSAVQRLEVRPNAVLRADAMAIFDRTFAITGAMQLLATLVAVIGVFSALLSLQLDKRREVGILRAVGLTVRQLWRLALVETGLMGAAAGLLALPTGLVLALILIYIINQRAFGWTLQLSVSALPFVRAFVLAVMAASMAAVFPTWRVSQMVTADAMRSE